MRIVKFFIPFVCILLAFQTSLAMGQLPFMPSPVLGKKAPDFTLKTAKGESLSMEKFRDGKNAIIFFWATWCPHCRAQLKKLSEGSKELEAKEIKMILVDIGESAQEVNSYIAKNNIGFEVFLDEENVVSEQYGIIGVPTFFFVAKDGKIKEMDHALPANIDEVFKE